MAALLWNLFSAFLQGLSESIEIIGAVFGTKKTEYYQNASIFVLPTFSENFGLVVAEALACGVPVITTKGAPWSAIVRERCGWWIDIGVEPLKKALQEAMDLTDIDRYEMGQRGQEYIKTFDWDIISTQMHEVYQWLQGNSKKPNCLRVD